MLVAQPHPHLAALSNSLRPHTRFARLGPTAIPALLVHPDWTSPAPTLLWLHGRTVSKELDNGRYLRLLRAGIASCAIDLPGHGERLDHRLQQPAAVPELLERGIAEIDALLAALASPPFAGLFDHARLALGGMSAGGMISLRRLCDPHPFACAAVEGTAGDLALLYGPGGSRADPSAPAATFPPHLLARLNPRQHLASWRPIPLLALHSDADQIVPVAAIRDFLADLRLHYAALNADPASITLTTWPTTGAPLEHNGFGLRANDAKTAHVDFLTRHLRPSAPPTQSTQS